MSQETQIPNESERKAFVEKLGQFRSSLQPRDTTPARLRKS